MQIAKTSSAMWVFSTFSSSSNMMIGVRLVKFTGKVYDLCVLLASCGSAVM